MAKLSAEAKDGLLVLVGSVILMYMTFAVGKYEIGEKKGYRVVALFDSWPVSMRRPRCAWPA